MVVLFAFIIPLLVSVVPLIALTVASARLGRSGLWLVGPWAAALVWGIISAIGMNLALSRLSADPALMAPRVIFGGLTSGASLGVLVFSLQLAFAGARPLRQTPEAFFQ